MKTQKEIFEEIKELSEIIKNKGLYNYAYKKMKELRNFVTPDGYKKYYTEDLKEMFLIR